MPPAQKKSATAQEAAKKGAKAPQDNQAASTVADQAGGNDIGVEVDGHTYTIAQDALDDFELLEDLGELDKGNAARLPSILQRLLGGAEEYRATLDRLRDPDSGRVSVERGAEFVQTLLESANPNA